MALLSIAGRLLSDLRGDGRRGGERTSSTAFSSPELVGRVGGVIEGCFCSMAVKERWWFDNGAGERSRAGMVVSSSGPNATRTDLWLRRGSVDPLVAGGW